MLCSPSKWGRSVERWKCLASRIPGALKHRLLQPTDALLQRPDGFGLDLRDQLVGRMLIDHFVIRSGVPVRCAGCRRFPERSIPAHFHIEASVPLWQSPRAAKCE